MKDGLSKVLALSPVTFTWKKDIDSKQVGKHDIGFIAQDVEKIVPEVVHTDSDGMKSIDYIKLVPILVNALQEQQAEIEELKPLVQDQQRRIQTLEAKLAIPVAANDNPPPTEELPTAGTK